VESRKKLSRQVHSKRLRKVCVENKGIYV